MEAMTTTDTAALLRAVLAEPAEDTTRLVYADALEEHGEGERAEFIRVHVELTNTPRCRRVEEQAGTSRQHAAVCRYCELKLAIIDSFNLARHFEWFAVPRGVVVPVDGVTRGFISHITCTTDDFLQHAPTIFANQPVTGVVLADKEPDSFRYGKLWRWFDGSRLRPDRTLDSYPNDADPSELPWDLWIVYESITDNWEHPTRAEALAALSDSCVSYGRSLVGLPPLKG